MLTIRDAQLALLSATRRQDFVDAMCAHLRRYFPFVTAQLAATELRLKVVDCLAAAQRFGLSSERDICHYLNLAAYYGWRFECDPDLLWMRRVLSDTDGGPPGNRLQALVEECLARQQAARRQRWHRPAPSEVRPPSARQLAPLTQGLLYGALKDPAVRNTHAPTSKAAMSSLLMAYPA